MSDSMKTCPDCKTENHVSSYFCSKCGHAFLTKPVVSSNPITKNPLTFDKSSKNHGCLAIFFFAFIFLFITFLLSNKDSNDSDSMVIVMAEGFVKKQLKAPSSADFSSISDTKIFVNGNRYTVKGFVDAQNSFGAKIRNNYLVIMEHDKGSTDYKLIDISVY